MSFEPEFHQYIPPSQRGKIDNEDQQDVSAKTQPAAVDGAIKEVAVGALRRSGEAFYENKVNPAGLPSSGRTAGAGQPLVESAGVTVNPIENYNLKSPYTSNATKFGDTAGFMDGEIEFSFSTQSIHENWLANGKIFNELKTNQHMYSDDTVFSDMTKAVMNDPELLNKSSTEIVNALAQKYCQFQEDPHCWQRAHGQTMMRMLHKLHEDPLQWRNNTVSNNSGYGCGAAMRTMPIGEKLFGEANRRKLLEVAIASSYITHTNPQGFLGGVASALFTAFAYENVPFAEWPGRLTELIKQGGLAWEIAQKVIQQGEDFSPGMFENSWNTVNSTWDFTQNTRLSGGNYDLTRFPDTPEGRDHFNCQFLHIRGDVYPGKNRGKFAPKQDIDKENWPGSSGHDAPGIAYDSLMLTLNKFLEDSHLKDTFPVRQLTPQQLFKLLEKSSPQQRERVFQDLVERACLHGGDSDSTGAIAFYWFAACAGAYAVPEAYTNKLEPSLF